MQECREAYNCQYTYSTGGILNSCKGGSDCRNKNTMKDCTKYVNCRWEYAPGELEALKASPCYTKKQCFEIDDFDECQNSFECNLNGSNGHLNECFDGGDCRTLETQDECESYANCGWKGETTDGNGGEEGVEGTSSSSVGQKSPSTMIPALSFFLMMIPAFGSF